MDNDGGDEEWRRRLKQVVGDHGGAATVARLAEIPPQTLKNHLNGRTKKAPLEDLKRIAEACGVSSIWLAALVAEAPVPAGLSEGDVAPYRGPDPKLEAPHGVNSIRRVVTSRALDLAGYLPGDIVDFRMDRKPKPGRPVLAQVYDEVGGAETVLRIYRPPFLLVHSSDPAIDPRPIPLDPSDTVVKIMGVFVQMIRVAG
ncbi:hypothetical protein ASD44_09865 [Mesorhizobium sp. Root554]|nr:hypothetical protein ASD27_09875 [Mesorhizobium sp. Root1471]KQZ36855.1 hypothetical protein ASD44_09865 [Mesorhizobium sp. Root554]